MKMYVGLDHDGPIFYFGVEDGVIRRANDRDRFPVFGVNDVRVSPDGYVVYLESDSWFAVAALSDEARHFLRSGATEFYRWDGQDWRRV